MVEADARLPLFRYRARDPATGRISVGETRGPDTYTVRSGLRSIGLEIVEVEPIQPRLRVPAWWAGRMAGIRRSRHRAQRADVADALSSLIGVGIPLERALADLAGSTVRDDAERRMLADLRDAIRAGETLDQAAARHPDWFDEVDTAVLAVGHRSGELERVLADLSRSHQRVADTGHRLVMALSYPLLLLVAAVAVVLFIGNQTLPQLIRILRESHVAVPALTQAVQLTGQIALTWCWLIVPAVIGAVIAVRSAVARLDPQRGLRLRLSRLPWNRARQRLRVAAIAGVLSQLLRSGVGLAEALDVAGRTASEKPMRDLLAACAAGVRRGEPLSATVSASPLLDPEFAQLLRVGEQTGELAAMCARITERYERAAQRSIDRLAAFLEPVAILIMAAIIGTVVMAAILPLLALGDIL